MQDLNWPIDLWSIVEAAWCSDLKREPPFIWSYNRLLFFHGQIRKYFSIYILKCLCFHLEWMSSYKPLVKQTGTFTGRVLTINKSSRWARNWDAHSALPINHELWIQKSKSTIRRFLTNRHVQSRFMTRNYMILCQINWLAMARVLSTSLLGPDQKKTEQENKWSIHFLQYLYFVYVCSTCRPTSQTASSGCFFIRTLSLSDKTMAAAIVIWTQEHKFFLIVWEENN